MKRLYIAHQRPDTSECLVVPFATVAEQSARERRELWRFAQQRADALNQHANTCTVCDERNPSYYVAEVRDTAHGGAREGAGRKAAEPGGVDRAFRLYPRHLELIARWQREHANSSASEAVRQMLEAAVEA